MVRVIYVSLRLVPGHEHPAAIPLVVGLLTIHEIDLPPTHSDHVGGDARTPPGHERLDLVGAQAKSLLCPLGPLGLLRVLCLLRLRHRRLTPAFRGRPAARTPRRRPA